MNTVRAKILLLMIFIITILSVIVYFVRYDTYKNYKIMKLEQCRINVMHHIDALIATVDSLENSVHDLSLAGEILVKGGNAENIYLGKDIVSHIFLLNPNAVGGGLWFEPYTINPKHEYLCYYVFLDDGKYCFDDTYQKEPNYYPKEEWYIYIKEQLSNIPHDKFKIVWTAPYTDKGGSNSLMITAGSGIYDDDDILVGMSTADWKLDYIINILSALRPTPSSFALFASTAHDMIIVLNDNTLVESQVGKSLSTISWYQQNLSPSQSIVYNGKTYLSFSIQIKNGLLLVINVDEDELFYSINATVKTIVIIQIIGMFLLVASIWLLLNHYINKPIKVLSKAAVALGQGDLDTNFNLHGNDEFARLAQTFNSMTHNLKQYIKHLNSITAEKEHLNTELAIAKQIQNALLPGHCPPNALQQGVDIYAKMVPAQSIGGDFYDYFFIDDTSLYIVIADVSGKGIPAALFMAVTKTLIRNNALTQKGASEVLAETNRQLCENSESGMFVTVALGILNIQTGLFTYSNAGHNSIYINKDGKNFQALSRPKGIVLGVLESAEYTTENVLLSPGDILFLYTDGVTDATDSKDNFWGENNLEHSLNQALFNSCDNTQTFLSCIENDLNTFCTGATQFDDITMLTLSYKKYTKFEYKALFIANIKNLHDFLDFIEKSLDQMYCAKKERNNFIIVAEELFVNITNYAYGKNLQDVQIQSEIQNQVQKSVQVEAILNISIDNPSLASLSLIDNGLPFNPLLNAKIPDITLPLNERPIGGLGIFLVTKLSNSIHYEYKEGKNILTVTMNFRKGETA